MIKKKIVFITEDLSNPIDEGMKKYNHSLIHFIQANFSDFRIYSRTLDDPTIVYEKLKGKMLISLHLLRSIRNYNPEFILYSPLASGTLSSFLKLFLLKLAGRKRRTALINLQRRQHGVLGRMIIKCIKPNKVIIFSKRDYHYFKALNIKSEFSRTGVDLNIFSPVSPERKTSIRTKYGFKTDCKILLHTGHINHGRNIEILESLIDEESTILIVGSTSTSIDQILEEKLREKGIKIIDSYLDHIEEIYQMSDAYIFPVINDHSAIEFPLSVLEAMACNLPVITTPYGSLTDYFKPSHCYVYFENTQNLASQVHKILQSECNNRMVVAERFSWEAVFDDLFKNLLTDDFIFDRN